VEEAELAEMNRRINLRSDELIVFLGSMNAMPMMYAWELKKRGYNVLYFVDAPIADALSRPENHFADIEYPYPEWIIEIKIPTQMILPYFSALHAKVLLQKIRAISKNRISCFVLNGFFISLAPWLKSHGQVVALSHGSDLDVWANKSQALGLANSFCRRSLFKLFPRWISKKLIVKAVENQYLGFCESQAVVYFPTGFNDAGDEVLGSICEKGVSVVERYDVSFEPLKNVSVQFKEPGQKTVIFCGVRFLYRTFPDGNSGYSKGNDVIIRGLAKYLERNKNIEIHFVEKGEDVSYAKTLCSDVGLDGVALWHKEMPFKELINLYSQSDICFDQVGEHWIGAIGAYALYLGKPLVANVATAVNLKVFPVENPIMSVKTDADIFRALVKLEDIEFRRRISHESKLFVKKHMGAEKALETLFLRDQL
jgi:glycosyltransferase involved in cell wall biosynthesis